MQLISEEARQVIELVRMAGFTTIENHHFCKLDKDLFGYVDDKKRILSICMNLISHSGYDPGIYVNETILHESVHVAQFCNKSKPFGINPSRMQLTGYKMMDVKKSNKASRASWQIEHEAYWMEDKPNEIKYVLRKYCL